MVKMHGVIIPIVTPFTADDRIDVEALRRLVDYLIDNGVDSLYPNGTTGEMLKLTVEERKLVAEEVLKSAGGRVPVFVQVGAPTTAQTVELARHAVSVGAAGIGVVTPQFFGVNFREMVEFYVQVANSVPVDFPVYLYNIPQCAANDITPEMVEAILARTKNVVGIKYSYADFIRLKNYLLCADGRFDVVVGPDRLFLPGLAMGCVGVVTGCAQCGPAPFVQVYSKFKEGDMAGALVASRQASELAEIVKAGANMAYFKAAMEYNGLGRTHMRAPALDLTDAEREELFSRLRDYEQKYGIKR
jgi:4-hydroxy-tetrahydrodipicolinate synthase